MLTNDYKIHYGISAKRLELHYNAAVFAGTTFFKNTLPELPL
jgi:hypothetical protein